MRTEDGNLSSLPQDRKRMLDAHLKEMLNTLPEGTKKPQSIDVDILSDDTVKDILGEEQQGFRQERSCLDNLLILNTMYGTKGPPGKTPPGLY